MFTWPAGLFALVLVPLMAWAYRWTMRRRAAATVALRPLQLSDAASGRRAGRRRHIPPAFYLTAITLLLLGLSRPTVPLQLPRLQGTVILAFDVSTSMLADDLKPTRMDAAREAARTFVKSQPRTIQVGIVAFSDTAFVVQPPTNVRADLLAAIDRLTPQGGTSVSEGLFRSLSAITGKQIVVHEAASEEDMLTTDIGYFGSAVIVILSDGEHTSASDPLAVAQLAANAGVRVFPVGLGNPRGATIEIDGYRIATALNEPLLSEIAGVTNGSYARAETATELTQIYDTIDLGLTTPGERIEVTSILTLAAMALLVVGALLSMRWFGRVP